MSSKTRAGDHRPQPRSPTLRLLAKFKLKRAFITFLYLAALLTAILYIAPRMMEGRHYTAALEKLISVSLGMEVSVGEFNVEFLGPAISFSHIVLMDKDSPVFTIKKARAKFSLWSTLKGRVVFDELELTEPTVNLLRRRDGAFNLPFIGERGGFRTKTVSLSPEAILGLVKTLNISGGKAIWTDRKIPGGPVREQLTRFSFKVIHGDKADTSLIFTSGQFENGATPSRFAIDGQVTRTRDKWGELKAAFSGRVKLNRFDIGRFWPYIDPHVPFQKIKGLAFADLKVGVGLDGSFSSSGRLRLSDIGIKYKQAFKKDIKPQDMIIDHEIAGKSGEITIHKASVSLGPLVVNAWGEIDRLNSTNPELNLTIGSNLINLNDLRQFVPIEALTTQQAAFLNDNLARGKIKIEDISFKGDYETLSRLDKPESYKSFSGALFIKDFNFTFDTLTYDFEEISGSVKLKGNSLRFKDVKGRYGLSRLENVSGMIGRLHGWPTFDFDIKAGLDLEEARWGLANQLASPEVSEFIGRIESMDGSVSVDLSVSGDSGRMPESMNIGGKMTFTDVGMKSPEIGLPIYEVNGEIELDLNDMYVSGMTWRAGSSSFMLVGSIEDIMKHDPRFDLFFSAKVNLEETGDIKYVDFGTIYNHTGQAVLDVSMSGGFDKFQIAQRLDMTYAGFRFKDIVDKTPGFYNVLSFKGVVKNRENLEINRLVIELGESEIVMTGQVGRFLREQGIDLTFHSSGARFDDLDKFLKAFEDIGSEGLIKGKFSIKRASASDPVELSGRVEVKDGGFKIPIFHEPFTKSNAVFELFGNQIFMDGEAQLGEGRFKAVGGMAIKDINEFTIKADAEQLDLYALFGPPEAKPAEPVEHIVEEPLEQDKIPEKRKFFDGLWNIIVASDSGTIGHLKYQDLSTRIKYRDKVFHIAPFTFKGHGGDWSWQADLKLVPEGIRFDSDVDISGMMMEDYLVNAAETTKIASGALNLTGSVSGYGKGWERIKRTLQGEIYAEAGKGVFHRFNMLSKIFSLLNLTQYFKLRLPDLAAEGMPFYSVNAKFGLEGGVAHTENLLVDSEAMRVSAIGDYDIGNSAFDVKVGVMPFIMIDRVVSSIPVVGKVLTGEDKSLITSYYVVKGPVANPEVKSAPLESFTESVIGIFKRILEIPGKAITNLNKTKEKPKNK